MQIHEPIQIHVKGCSPNNEILITLPWDANLEDWRNTFKAILMHQVFTEDQIKDLFYDEFNDPNNQ